MLTRYRVADGEAGAIAKHARLGDEEEAVAAELQTEGPAKPGDGVELGVGGGGGPVVEGEEVTVPVVGGDGECGLACVVGQEEATGGGGAAPGAADGAAAEEGFGGQADEDLPDEDLIREAGVERRGLFCARGLRHGRRLGERFLAGAVEWVTAAERGGRPRNKTEMHLHWA